MSDRMTQAELKTRVALLQRVANDPRAFDHDLDLRPLREAIRYRWVGVKVTDRGELHVTLTQAGRKALHSGEAF